MRLTHSRNGETFTASLLSLTLLLGMTPAAGGFAGNSRPAPPAARANADVPKRGVRKTFAQLPSFFEENAGQFAGNAKFVSRGAGHTLLLGAVGVTLALKRAAGRRAPASRRTARRLGRTPAVGARRSPPINSSG